MFALFQNLLLFVPWLLLVAALVYLLQPSNKGVDSVRQAVRSKRDRKLLEELLRQPLE